MSEFNLTLVAALVSSALAILYSAAVGIWVLRQPEGTPAAEKIASAIAEGAAAFLARQYLAVAVVGLIIFILILLLINLTTAVGFAVGAALSAAAGYVGMTVSVRANVRTAAAATDGLKTAFLTAFRGGSVAGLIVAALALAAVAGTFAVTGEVTSLIGLGLGGSLISVFARLGGGIYTKGADIGADLVGKVEKAIPEDDPRNPAVIADNVGDNVGDVAGMAADLFETYAVTTIAAMLLARLVFGNFENAVLYPISLAAAAIIATIAGTFFVRIIGKSAMGGLYLGLGVTSVLSAIFFYFTTFALFPSATSTLNPVNLYWSSLVGIGVTFGMVVITEFFTSTKFAPVKAIAQSSATGAATNIISGLANGLKSTLPPVILITAAILAAYNLAGLYGIAIAAVAMLSQTGMIVAIDAFGPITDNAGGIAEMAHLPEDVRVVTDSLDAVGNTTKAVTKGYAIASAALASLVLFAVYSQELAKLGGTFEFLLSDPQVLSGLLIGAALPFIFTALALEAVGVAGSAVVEEVRRQFREIKGIMAGHAKPDYAACVRIVTTAALRKMILPASITLVTPILVGIILGPVALGGFLIGSIVTGLFLAISMTTGGAAWDNAKKFIEAGNLGGKGSETHKAAVIGDTVGDPYKDTAGPAINPMIKVVNIVAILILPAII